MTDKRTLIGFGIADIAIGLLIWAVTDNATLGLALVVAGIAVLGFAAFRSSRSSHGDPDAARRNQQADEQRQQGSTDAETENIEGRPPATGA